ncbi:hypothetical protein DFH29DRAFT_1008637 [Suillus ampliporus]|nr:hypothetical protein DFH29DRAFT_1008637 [Suillus ampliporus]
MTGLPRDAPAVVDDFEELRTRPKRPEKVPAWAEAIIPLDKVMDILDSVETVVHDWNACVFPMTSPAPQSRTTILDVAPLHATRYPLARYPYVPVLQQPF